MQESAGAPENLVANEKSDTDKIDESGNTKSSKVGQSEAFRSRRNKNVAYHNGGHEQCRNQCDDISFAVTGKVYGTGPERESGKNLIGPAWNTCPD